MLHSALRVGCLGKLKLKICEWWDKNLQACTELVSET